MATNLTPSLVLIFLFSVTFLACNETSIQTEKKSAKAGITIGGALRVPISDIPNSLAQTNFNTLNATAIGIHLHEGLVRLDPKTSKPIPALAESWSIEKNGGAYIFNLRKGARFHQSSFFDGKSREITVKDVAYSFNELAHTSSAELFAATLANKVVGAEAFRNGEAESFGGVQVIDDYTIKIELQKPDASFLLRLAQPAFGVGPMNFKQGENGLYIGAGPFAFTSAKNDITLTKNPDYFLEDEFGNQYPYLDTLIFTEVESTTDELEAFFNGNVDVISDLELDPVRDILEQHVSGFSGKNPEYVMKRETDNASYETYTVYRSGITNLGTNFMGYRDFSRVQVEQ